MLERINIENNILDIYKYVENLFKERKDENLTYHNWEHTKYVYATLKLHCEFCNFEWSKTEPLLVAALFHDVGYLYGYDNHEDRSIETVRKYLKEKNRTEKFISNVSKIINTTKISAVPTRQSDLYLLKDVDISYGLGCSFDEYERRSKALRKEWGYILNKKYSDEEWIELEYSFLRSVTYYSSFGKEQLAYRFFNKKKIHYPSWLLEKLREKYID